MKQSIKPDFARWHVLRSKSFIKAFSGRRLAGPGADETATALESIRRSRLPLPGRFGAVAGGAACEDDTLGSAGDARGIRGAAEGVRAGLRLPEDSERKLAALRHLLEESERSGHADYNYETLIRELGEPPT